MGIEPDTARGVRLRPVLKTALRKAFLAEPKTLAVVGQKLDRVTPPRTEDKQRTAQRVAGQRLAAQGSQTINALAEIDRLDRHQNRKRPAGDPL